ncbi:MAG TPA: hypothetical protein VEA61_14080 [Allosphingosinicella sp.]|nr:hypothetical protein [Allosphingosinicella sp.]
MRKALRWAGIGLGAVFALLLAAALVVLAWSELILRKDYRAAAETLPAPSAAEMDLGLMPTVASNDFNRLTDAEIDALYAYPAARPKRLGS